MRATPRITLSAVGSAPPARLVPAPRGTTGTPISWQSARTRLTSSSVEPGSTTASGGQL